ncbi:MAG: type II toxin-antitoxin system RelE/ParE family toxin [Candidatus Thermoplasmatota archaeon]|nr:type II toxin-antitoxin system RelE/ParE family toxin [Candidatus Thermoplasmatota archaeon]MBU1941382.1 type II toxin-antitoxin system RelE/ParE family toxin [Candidatus Thermoplasmatota archaeon]
MTYTVLVSRTFQKSFHTLPKNTQNNVKNHLKELQKDPITPRPQYDIRLLQNTYPKKYRLQIGEYRIIYTLDKKNIKIIEFIKREIRYSRSL